MADVKLMNLFWSSAGIQPGQAEISPFDFVDRVKSAAKAGFAGMSFWHTDLDHICKTRPLAEVKRILDDHGLSTYEVEFIEDWFVEGDRKAASDQRKARLLAASLELGAHHVKVGDFKRTPIAMPKLIEAFAALCTEAATHGATIGFEFMSSAMIHRLDDCLAMLSGANAPNGGLIVDIAHCNELAIPFAEVARIPHRFMVSVELGDNLKRTSPGYDPGARRYCGEGELDVASFIAAARATGYSGPWGVEVINRAYTGWPLEELDQHAFDTTLPFVAR